MAEIRGASKLGITVEGLPELQAQFNKLGKMPKKYLTKAGREGIAQILKDSRKPMAPTGKTGNLKKSIKKKMETPNKRNKGVYRLRYDPKFTHCFSESQLQAFMVVQFQKLIIPASVEYGYLGEAGHVAVKTMHWANKALQSTEQSSMKKTIDSLMIR